MACAYCLVCFSSLAFYLFIFVVNGQGSSILREAVGLLISSCSSSMDLVFALARYTLEILVISLVMFIYFGETPLFAYREAAGKLDAHAGEERGMFFFSLYEKLLAFLFFLFFSGWFLFFYIFFLALFLSTKKTRGFSFYIFCS